jgi:biotin transport system substrate-specific component
LSQINVKEMVLVALFAALTAVSAWISLHIGPVPVSLQVFFVLLAGAVLGGNLGALSQFVYVLLGAFGLPVFAGGGSGFGILFGPTGGYLLAFIVVAYFIGKLVEIRPELTYAMLTIVMLVGVVIIYLFGVVQLALVTHMSMQRAFLAGALYFIPADLVKALVAALVTQRIKKAGIVVGMTARITG